MQGPYLQPKTKPEVVSHRNERSWCEYLLICQPTKPTERKQLPLISAHTDILDGAVDDLGFAYRKSDLIFTGIDIKPKHTVISRIMTRRDNITLNLRAQSFNSHLVVIANRLLALLGRGLIDALVIRTGLVFYLGGALGMRWRGGSGEGHDDPGKVGVVMFLERVDPDHGGSLRGEGRIFGSTFGGLRGICCCRNGRTGSRIESREAQWQLNGEAGIGCAALGSGIWDLGSGV